MPQSDPTPPDGARRDQDFVIWPEENGGKRTETGLQAVAGILAAGPGLVGAAGESSAPDAPLPDEVAPEPTFYPATSAWRRTTSRAPVGDQERWWDAGSPVDRAAPGPPAPQPDARMPGPLLSPDEIWELTARELEEAPVLRTKAQAPTLRDSAGFTEPIDPIEPIEPVEVIEVIEPDEPTPWKAGSGVGSDARPGRGAFRPTDVFGDEDEVADHVAPPRDRTFPLSAFPLFPQPAADEPGSGPALVPLRASPFRLATSSEMNSDPALARGSVPADTDTDDGNQGDRVYPQTEGSEEEENEAYLPDYESSPARPVFTFWRLAFLLLLGAAVAVVVYRDELSGVDWRALWSRTVRSLTSITKPPPAPPVRRAVLLPTPSKRPATDAPDQATLIESPSNPKPTEVAPATPRPGVPIDPSPPPEPSREAPTGANPDAASGAGPERDAAEPSQSSPLEAASDPSMLWGGDDPAATSAANPRARPANQMKLLSTADQSEAAAAHSAVQNLVAADAIHKVLPWIFEPEKLSATVAEYHTTHPLKPLNDAVVEMEYSGIIPSTGAKAFIFNVLHSDHPRGFPVSAEHTPQGYRIDWQSYIQWRDEWLRRFVEKKPSEPQMLFVVLRRTHYFNDDVPRLDEKLCFRLTSAVPGDEGIVAFVDHPSPLGRSLAGTYEWRKLYFPVVEVQWIREPDIAPYVRLNRIVRPTWRRVGD